MYFVIFPRSCFNPIKYTGRSTESLYFQMMLFIRTYYKARIRLIL